MEESDITNWYQAGKKIIENFYKDYNYERFRPFYHGTSSYHIKNIKKLGLCPRGETPSVWDELPSHKDRIYFAQCQDYLPNTAANYAVSQAEWFRNTRFKKNIPIQHIYKGEKLEKTFQDVDFSEEPITMFVKFDAIDKYKEFIDADTDRSYIDEITDPDYNYQTFYKQDPHSNIINNSKASNYSVLCSSRIEKSVIDVLDTLWIKCGWKCVKDIIDKDIPPSIKSLYALPLTISLRKCSIPPEDLTVLTKEEWNEDKKNCWEWNTKTGGCDNKEITLKQKYANLIEKYDVKFWTYHDIERRVKEKARSREAEKEIPFARKELVDYIQKEKVPKFLQMLEKL
ncbi:hypothetical protein LCGC14_0223160 [marine sediment metagenome]|uniref:Uncharacterized protein n=1 Tax=marine sediment metagenome TaxID=412755 RepID=A0A0F9XFU5_9ZZZZ|nr:hypothetical protein [bacterium]